MTYLAAYTSEGGGASEVFSVESLSPEEAAAWLQAKGRELLRLDARIVDLQHRAALLAQKARERGHPELAERAKDAIRVLGELNQQWTPVADKLRWIADQWPALGLAGLVVPAAIAGAVVVTAVAGYFLIQKVGEQERILDLIAEGVLTPEEAASLSWLGSGTQLVKWLTVAAVVGAGIRLWMDR